MTNGGQYLSRPTVDLVEAECAKFDSEFPLSEEALFQLLDRFPGNAHKSHVLLKVIALDKLYSTRVDGVDIFPLAAHIAASGNDLDEMIQRGDPEAVRRIWKDAGTTKKYYSFATKFCSWHNQLAYPIWDSYVDACLWAYKREFQFEDFQRQDLTYYERLVKIVDSFRARFVLQQCSYKQLDKFFWRTGSAVLSGGIEQTGLGSTAAQA